MYYKKEAPLFQTETPVLRQGIKRVLFLNAIYKPNWDKNIDIKGFMFGANGTLKV
jgi:hypothetical protein